MANGACKGCKGQAKRTKQKWLQLSLIRHCFVSAFLLLEQFLCTMKERWAEVGMPRVWAVLARCLVLSPLIRSRRKHGHTLRSSNTLDMCTRQLNKCQNETGIEEGGTRRVQWRLPALSVSPNPHKGKISAFQPGMQSLAWSQGDLTGHAASLGFNESQSPRVQTPQPRLWKKRKKRTLLRVMQCHKHAKPCKL